MRRLHIVSTKQFQNKKLIEEIFRRTRYFQTSGNHTILSGKILANLFYEPSTRTRFSFEAAMLKLGGNVISTESASLFSSAAKGEILEDTIKIVGRYADAIVLRHSEQGAAARAAAVSSVPIINAGDGAGEHPTQALLDLYTIEQELGTTSGLSIALMGDLLYGRTIHSLIQLLLIYKPKRIYLIAPPELQLPQIHIDELIRHQVPAFFTQSPDEVYDQIDVLYVTRIQKERFASPELYERLKNLYRVESTTLWLLPAHAVIMHPLPRLDEIDPVVDADPRAAYFRQAHNGLFVRMALLSFLLEP